MNLGQITPAIYLSNIVTKATLLFMAELFHPRRARVAYRNEEEELSRTSAEISDIFSSFVVIVKPKMPYVSEFTKIRREKLRAQMTKIRRAFYQLSAIVKDDPSNELIRAINSFHRSLDDTLADSRQTYEFGNDAPREIVTAMRNITTSIDEFTDTLVNALDASEQGTLAFGLLFRKIETMMLQKVLDISGRTVSSPLSGFTHMPLYYCLFCAAELAKLAPPERTAEEMQELQLTHNPWMI